MAGMICGVPAPQSPSYEDLAGLVAALEVEVRALREDNERLRAENSELRGRLGMDSTTSSRPPSSDSPYAKPSGLRGRSGGKPGKQRGEPGVTRRQVDNPDERVGVEPGGCGGCGADLADALVVGVQKRQVFEASPPPPPRVVQFEVVARLCSCCGQVSVGRAPGWASGRVQWGPSVAARGVLATIGHHLPYGRAARLLSQLCGLQVSTGFLVAARKRAARLLEPFMARVRQLLHAAGLLHVDETPPAPRVDWPTCTWPATSSSPRCTPAGGPKRTSTLAGSSAGTRGCSCVTGTPVTSTWWVRCTPGVGLTCCVT